MPSFLLFVSCILSLALLCVAEAEKREQLAKIHEVLPGYGDGFLTACLHAAGGDSARVITQLLEGSLPGTTLLLMPLLFTLLHLFLH